MPPDPQCCVWFLQTYLNRVRKMKTRNPEAAAPHAERVKQLIPEIQQKIIYPIDFDFNTPGDLEQEFITRRKVQRARDPYRHALLCEVRVLSPSIL